jgi:glutathione peroxidase
MARLHEISLTAIDGNPLDLGQFAGRALLVVNVASKCGLTPQYEGLQRLYERYRDRGFSVLGTPCNQFAGQEPGTPDEVAQFCSTTYQVSFPLSEKLEVNGRRRHPLYRELTRVADAAGRSGDVQWNFEKFLVSPAGEVAARFRPQIEPESEELVGALEQILPAPADAAWTSRTAGELRPGDRIRLDDASEMTVTRIESNFFDREGLVCLIEDSEVRWLAHPLPGETEVEVLATTARN